MSEPEPEFRPEEFAGDDPYPAPDAHGQAALLLLESLIHALIDNGTLKPNEAIETLASAIEVKVDIARDHDEPPAVLAHSLLLLRQIASSIHVKLGVIGDD